MNPLSPNPLKKAMSDEELLGLHQETASLKGKGRKLRSCLAANDRPDYSECPGLGSFQGLLDRLSDKYKWTEAELAVPAALAVFVPKRLWTQAHIQEIRAAIAAVSTFMGSKPPERAWEFAMGWLLGADGRDVNWDSEGWEGPMEAWGAFKLMVYECVAVTCVYLGGPLRSGNGALPRGNRVPYFKDIVVAAHLAEWTEQICEALTLKNGAGCLCAERHILFLRDPKAAAHEAAAWAEAKGLPKLPGLKTPNAVKKIKTHYSWHDLGAWKSSLPLALFLRRAVRGGCKKIKPGEIPSGMLFHLLREATGLEQASVAVKKCRLCTEQWQKKNDQLYRDANEKVSDVVSFYPDHCDQCKGRFANDDFPFARRMLILSMPSGGFVGREASVCGDRKCGVVFDPSEANHPRPEKKGTKAACPKCSRRPSQRKSWVYFFNGDSPPDQGGGAEPDSSESDAEALADLDDGDFTWIRELVEILVERNNGQPFPAQPDLPDNALELLKSIPNSPRDMEQMRSKWLALKSLTLWGALEDRALRPLNPDWAP
jgi:hypothetical protein